MMKKNAYEIFSDWSIDQLEFSILRKTCRDCAKFRSYQCERYDVIKNIPDYSYGHETPCEDFAPNDTFEAMCEVRVMKKLEENLD